jgi:hypothetical protein
MNNKIFLKIFLFKSALCLKKHMLNVRRLSSRKQNFYMDINKGKVMMEVFFDVQGLVRY